MRADLFYMSDYVANPSMVHYGHIHDLNLTVRSVYYHDLPLLYHDMRAHA